MTIENSSEFNALADSVIRDFKELEGARHIWESHWEDIVTVLIPELKNSFNRTNHNVPGERKTAQQLDASPQIALSQFASIMDSLLTPRTQTWHRLKATDPVLNKDREVQLYFDEVTRLLFMHRYADQSNFSSQNLMVYEALGALGTGPMFIDALDTRPGIRYKSIPLGESFIRENHQGIVDTMIRHFKLTARQAMIRWGNREDATLPEAIIRAAKGKKPDELFEFLHRVQPRNQFDPSRLDAKNKPFESVYIAFKAKSLISEKGFQTFPYIVPRYRQTMNEVYGRSPAMMALPAINTLMEQKKTILKQGHRTVDPVLLAHDDGIMNGMDMLPGAVNFGGVNADGRQLVHALPVGRVDAGRDMMDDERQIINSAFLVHLFQILAETPRMTATEVIERTREKGILLAPTVGSQQSEYLGPMIERELDVLEQQGILPEMPGLLKEAAGDFTVVYDSPLSRMMRAEEAGGLIRTIETINQSIAITQDPSPMDNLDMDVITREVADINAVPTRWLKAEDDVAAIRQQRAEAQARQEQMQAAPGNAAMLNAVGNAKSKGVTEEDLE